MEIGVKREKVLSKPVRYTTSERPFKGIEKGDQKTFIGDTLIIDMDIGRDFVKLKIEF